MTNDACLNWDVDNTERGPGQFIREIDARIASRGIGSDEKKLELLYSYLSYAGEADSWYESLDPAAKTKWDQVKTLFMAEFPDPKKRTTKTKDKLIEDLKNHTLKEEELGYEDEEAEEDDAEMVK